MEYRSDFVKKEAAGQQKELLRQPDPENTSDLDIRRFANNWAPYLGFNL